jgi:hypothetical protein
MATGQLPFRGDSTATIFEAILNRAPVVPVRLNPDVPPELERIINKALEKDRNLRYQHAADMRTSLQRLKRDTESGMSAAGRDTTSLRGSDSTNRLAGPWKSVALTSVVVVLAVAGYFYFILSAAKRAVSVEITTVPPDAVVTVGAETCRAPCDLSLLPGTYSLRAERDGYEPVTRQVSIARNTKSLPTVKLDQVPVQTATPSPTPVVIDQGTLIIHANVGGAEVYVDRNLKGLTDVDKKFEDKFDIGNHEIVLRKQGYADSSEQVEIAKGGTSIVTFKLTEQAQKQASPAPAYLVLQAPPGASILIDQEPRGTVPPEGGLIQKVVPGRHSIEAKLDGYEPWSGSATAESGKQVSVAAELIEIPKPKPVISFFTPSASSIQHGQPAHLSWQTEHADEVSIDGGSVEKNGSKEVKPNSRTTYTLMAQGLGGTDSRQVTIDVVPPAAPTETAPTTAPAVTAPATAPATAPPVASTTTPSSEAKQCIDRYKSAYELKSVNELTKVWPSLADNTQAKNAFETFFRLTQKIVLQEQCVEPPSVSGDTAHYQCSETVTNISSGSARRFPTRAVQFACKKTSTGWVVASKGASK